MAAEFLLLTGPNRPQSVRLTKTATVGRGAAAGLRISSRLVSREHCRVTPSANRVTVADLGSRNGTFVADRQIAGPTVLKPGQTLRVGPLSLHLPADDGATESEVVTWLAPAPGDALGGDSVFGGDTVSPDSTHDFAPIPPAGAEDSKIGLLPPAPDKPADPVDDDVRFAARVVRDRSKARAA